MVVDRDREYMVHYKRNQQFCLNACFDPTCQQTDVITERLVRSQSRNSMHPLNHAARVRRMIENLQRKKQTFGTKSLHTLAAGPHGCRWFLPGEVEVRPVALRPLYSIVSHGFKPWKTRYKPAISYESTYGGGEVTTIRLKIDGGRPQTFIRPASNKNENGPVASIEAILLEALTPTFPALRRMKMIDYFSKNIDLHKGTESRVVVYMRLRSTEDPGEECFGTYVQRDLVKASFYCLCTAYLHTLALLEGKERGEDLGARNAPLVLYVPAR